MSRLFSKILGKGGGALLALYNIARELRIKAITYLVHDHNTRAKLFYHRMNFGSPVNERWTEWRVAVDYPFSERP